MYPTGTYSGCKRAKGPHTWQQDVEFVPKDLLITN